MNIPDEYHGPHAKRWTHPDTGRTYSLRPSDFVAVVGQYQLDQEQLRRDWEADKDWLTAITGTPTTANIRGPQPITAYIDEHTLISDGDGARKIREAEHRVLHAWGQADASVEGASMLMRGPERLAHFVIDQDGSIRGLPQAVAAKAVADRGGRRGCRASDARMCRLLVYIIIIIGVTMAVMN